MIWRVLHFGCISKGAKTNTGPKRALIWINPVGHFILLDFDSCLIVFGTVPEGGYAAATALLLWAMGVLFMGQRGEVWSPLVLSSLLSKAVCRWFYFNILFHFCCGLEYLCSVADPGSHCLREWAYFIVICYCHCLCCSSCPFLSHPN